MFNAFLSATQDLLDDTSFAELDEIDGSLQQLLDAFEGRFA